MYFVVVYFVVVAVVVVRGVVIIFLKFWMLVIDSGLLLTLGGMGACAFVQAHTVTVQPYR